MNCKICDSESIKIFSQRILKKYDVDYFRCNSCGFIQTENPYWLEESYVNPLNNDDTGILKRNNDFLKKTAAINYFMFNSEKQFLDYAGGYGVFTRLMRDTGFDCYWIDKYAKNILAIGFEGDENKKYETVTAFEVFEHMVDPKTELEKILEYSDNIIFSTVLVGDQIPDKNWWYYGFNHGQHISLYTIKSLQQLANQYGLNFYSNGSSFHMFTKNEISNTYFKILLKLSKYGLFTFVKSKLQSKTDSDAAKIKQ